MEARTEVWAFQKEWDVALQWGKPQQSAIVAHMCGDSLSHCTCRVTRVAADFLRILGVFRCSNSIVLHPPLKGPVARVALGTARSVARQAASEKVSRYTGA